MDEALVRRRRGTPCARRHPSAHALHDGDTDLLYLLLPTWQSEFGLGYTQAGALRASYTATIAASALAHPCWDCSPATSACQQRTLPSPLPFC